MSNRNRSLARVRREARRQPLRQRVDPDAVYHAFAYAIDPVAFATEALGFRPDPWQAEMLYSESKRIVLNWARQTGKSDSVAILALHRAIYRPGSMILIVSPSERQSMEVLHKIGVHRLALRLPGRPLEDNKLSLELDNGSRIVSLPATERTIRGFSSVDLLIEDEAGDVPDKLHEAIKPMLQVSKGTMILMGTPKGPRGHFAQIWNDDSARWHRIGPVTAWMNPHNDKEDLRLEKEEMTRLGRLFMFQQEYECAFNASGQGLVYPYDASRNATKRLPMHRQFGWQFALGIDYGMKDDCAFVVLGWQSHDPNLYVVESFKKTNMLPSEAAAIAKALTVKYPFARMVGDAGGLGKPYVEEARRRLKLPIEAAEKNNKRGFIELFAGELKQGLIKVFPGNEELLAEWQLLPWDEERDKPAEGYDDHLADACLYAWRSCFHFVEQVRKNQPKKGTPEYEQQEADELFELHMQETERERTGGGVWAQERIPHDDPGSFFN